MPKQTVQMRLDDDLLAQIDAARALLRQTRTAFVVAALLGRLGQDDTRPREVQPAADDARRTSPSQAGSSSARGAPVPARSRTEVSPNFGNKVKP